MAGKYCGGAVPEAAPTAGGGLRGRGGDSRGRARRPPWSASPPTRPSVTSGRIVRQANKLIDDEKPWALAKDPAAHAAPRALPARTASRRSAPSPPCSGPSSPATAERMWHDLGLAGAAAPAPPAAGTSSPPGTALRPSGPLFPRIVACPRRRRDRTESTPTRTWTWRSSRRTSPPCSAVRARRGSPVVSVSIGVASLRRNLALAAAHPGFSTTAGVHPHEAGALADGEWREIEGLAGDPAVVAIGETGLDYHRDHAPRDRQIELFLRHVALARASASRSSSTPARPSPTCWPSSPRGRGRSAGCSTASPAPRRGGRGAWTSASSSPSPGP